MSLIVIEIWNLENSKYLYIIYFILNFFLSEFPHGVIRALSPEFYVWISWKVILFEEHCL